MRVVVPPTSNDAILSAGAAASRWVILVHGGAGEVPPARIAEHVAGCERAAAVGAAVLREGGTALDAVEASVKALEADPIFNAGTGACLNRDGHLELDAAIMDGATLGAGAVGALPPFAHPISIARRVMEATPHVLLAAEGAARFAVAQGFSPADEATMITDRARSRWEAAQRLEAVEGWAGGTVGAVARDVHGHVAAATSTGGMVNKLPGRIGDSPIVGAGTYADDDLGACSTTGDGEAMLRLCTAKATLDRLRSEGAEAAARGEIARVHARTSRTGGLILVARDGSIGLARSTRTMSWALESEEEKKSGS